MFQNVFYEVVSACVGIFYMEQVKAVVLADLLFLLVAFNYLLVFVMLRAVKFNCKYGFFFSAETFFVNYKIKAHDKKNKPLKKQEQNIPGCTVFYRETRSVEKNYFSAS